MRKKEKCKGKKKGSPPQAAAERRPTAQPRKAATSCRRHSWAEPPWRGRGRRRRTAAVQDACLGAVGALRRGAFVGGGGAARDWSPERPQRRREGGGGPRHGGGKSGPVALSRRLISGEEAAAVAAYLAVGSGVGGEARCGVGMRRRRRHRAGERREEYFSNRSLYFCTMELEFFTNCKIVPPRVTVDSYSVS